MLVMLAFWLLVITLLIILFAYDARWFLLPDVITYPLIVLALAYTTYSVATSPGVPELALSTTVSVLFLGGLYLVLWLLSKGTWVGFGDVKLGLALGLLLLDWRLAFLTLFLANLIGVLYVLPGLLSKRLSRRSQVPFGPFLIAGFMVALLFGSQLIGLYDHLTVWVASVTLMV